MSAIEQIISIIAPHYCTECGQEGKLICEKCTAPILNAGDIGCLLCDSSPNNSGVCSNCLNQSGIQAVWALGAYEGALERLIHDMKFRHKREAATILGEQLAKVIPEQEAAPLIIPLPTAADRMRQRGFDHSASIAKALARVRAWPYSPLLRRNHYGRQVGSDKRTRIQQAAQAYRLDVLAGNRPVLLIDDVLTTGASIKAAAQLLRQAGCQQIMAAVAAKQLFKG